MSKRTLTAEGKKFINEVCTNSKTGGDKLLSGKNNYPFPYSSPPLDKVWKCNINNVDTGKQLSEALISWFQKYADEYDLDANVIAAQAYAESNYVMWQYGKDNTDSGVSQLDMLTIFGIIVKNEGMATKMTQDEIDKITKNLIEPLVRNSYDVLSKINENALINRKFLHENVINNPDIMIKAQCRYMKMLSDACEGLASSTLFCYYTDKQYAANTYSKTINKCVNKHKNDDNYNQAAYNYVLKVFGILGDKGNGLQNTTNKTIAKVSGNYKPKDYYFGYDKGVVDLLENGVIKDKDPDLINLNLFGGFNAYHANVTESDEFNLNGYGTDSVVEALSKQPKYTYIYYPESDYFREKTNKTQIVLHHTVSGDNIASDILWWQQQVSKSGDKVATAFIVGRRGEIFQLFSTDYWAYHLGISSTIINENNLSGSANTTLSENSVGIEIDSWGGLINSGGYWYPATSDDHNPQQYIANTKVEPIKDVVTYDATNGYPNGYHGFYAFERYTDEQINIVKEIIIAVQSKFKDIKLGYANDIYNVDMWGTEVGGKWKPVQDALVGKSGIWSHVSYRYDKSDCHPQKELIDMLKSLQ